MKRFAVIFGCLMLFSSPALANSTFSKFWKAEFAGAEADEGFVKAVKTQGCYICHINGEERKRFETNTVKLSISTSMPRTFRGIM